MSPEAWPESNKLVSHLLSFVPRRLAEAFSNGYLTDDLTGSVEIAPVPQETEAALLLVGLLRQLLPL